MNFFELPLFLMYVLYHSAELNMECATMGSIVKWVVLCA